MKNQIIFYANYISLYFIAGILGVLAIKTIPAVLANVGIKSDVIGWFLFAYFLSWFLKMFYSPILEKYRQNALTLRNIVLSSNFFTILCLCLVAYVDYEHQILLLCLIFFGIGVSLSVGDVCLGALAIDSLKERSYSYINASRVICAALGAIIGSGVFLGVFEHQGYKSANLVIIFAVALLSIPSFLLHKIPLPKQGGAKTKISLLQNLKQVKKAIFLIPIANFGARLAMFMIGIFLVNKKIPLETLGIVFGAYSIISSVLGGVFGVVFVKKFGAKKSLIILLAIEILIFMNYIYQSISDNGEFYLIALFVVSLLFINLKFVCLYSLIMEYSQGESAVKFPIIQASEISLAILAPPIGGYIIKYFGYADFFGVCMFFSFVGLLVFGVLALKRAL